MEVNHNGQWGTVCDDLWGIREADVTCREMDCGTALEPRRNADFGEGSGPIWLDEVTCRGTETSLTQCRHLKFGEHDCNHGEDVGVVCSGEKMPMICLDSPKGSCKFNYYGCQFSLNKLTIWSFGSGSNKMLLTE